MGLIRVSDHAEELIKEHSHGRTITATVDAILAGSVAPDGTEMWKGQPASDDDLRDYLDKKFAHLESLIEDTTVDRVAGGRRVPGQMVYVDWDIVREIFYEFLKEGDPEWENKTVYDSVHESSDLDMAKFFIQDNKMFIESVSGQKFPCLIVTPRLKEYLANAGVDVL